MKPYYEDASVRLYHGDALESVRTLPDGSVNSCVTSPPYFGLRDYGEAGQYGLEASPAEYVETMRALFLEVRRVLAPDGTLWLNLGDSYGSATEIRTRIGHASGSRKPVPGRRKSLLMIPEQVCLALCSDGWILRNKVVWHKTNCMPERVSDRLSRKHEVTYLLTKQDYYWFDLDPIREKPPVDGANWMERKAAGAPGWLGPSRSNASETVPSLASHPLGPNPGDVWSLPTATFSEAHFAVMPDRLAERCILAGCKPGGTVMDPFSGSGTTGMVAQRHGRKYVGIDLSKEYLDLSLKTRLRQASLDFGEVS